MAVDWRERSEIIKNLVSAGAVIVGGLWVLYQWDTLFPKTSADVRSAAASVRTDVSGSFTVHMGLGDDGSPIAFRAPGASPEQGVTDYCSAAPGTTLIQSSPVFAQLVLRSASAIPVRVRVDRIDVSTTPIGAASMVPASQPKGSASAAAIMPVATIDDDRMFFGGLRENRVEKGQEVQVAMMFTSETPVRCEELERLMLFRAQVSLTAIDPTKDRPVGDAVPKVFVTTCQLNPRTAPVCNVKDVNALGQ